MLFIFTCQGLVKGAQLASSGIRRGSELIAEKIQPVTAPIAVDPKVKVGIDVAKKGSKAAVVAGTGDEKRGVAE